MLKSLTISSVGDVSFSTSVEGHDYDFSNWISGVVREFLKSNIQIGNLECVFFILRVILGPRGLIRESKIVLPKRF